MPAANLIPETSYLPATSASESLNVPASVAATCLAQIVLPKSSAGDVNVTISVSSDCLPGIERQTRLEKLQAQKKRRNSELSCLKTQNVQKNTTDI